MEKYIKETDSTHLEMTKKNLEKVFKGHEWRYVFFHLLLLEQTVGDGVGQFKDSESYADLLQKYADSCMEFYYPYYKQEIFANLSDVLPQSLQAAMKIQEYFELKNVDQLLANSKLQEVVKIYPKFKNGLCRVGRLDAEQNYVQIEVHTSQADQELKNDLKQREKQEKADASANSIAIKSSISENAKEKNKK